MCVSFADYSSHSSIWRIFFLLTAKALLYPRTIRGFYNTNKKTWAEPKFFKLKNFISFFCFNQLLAYIFRLLFYFAMNIPSLLPVKRADILPENLLSHLHKPGLSL